MRHIISLFILLIFTSCVNGPAIIENYSSLKTKNIKASKILIYKIIIDGDNFDNNIKNIILDKTSLSFKNLNAAVTINDLIFKNDIDQKNIIMPDEIINENYDYILTIFVRVKDLGYSILSLTDEVNIYMNISLFDGKGKLLTSSLFNRITSYSLSASSRFHWDLSLALLPIQEYVKKKK
jgi:hypothetical protein